MSETGPVSNVSDTARWVAVYRAWESARPDALFHDPYAARLAGEQGAAMARHMPRQARNGWPLVTRTRLIDEMVQARVAAGCDLVLNLAAGLDTRPYRLDLPATLRWIEVDLPPLLAQKQALLADASPRCRLERRAVDLTQPGALAALLHEVGATVRQGLVLTEGLLIYLTAEQVRALSAELLAVPTLRDWIADIASPDLIRFMMRTMGRQLERAPMRFAPPEGVAWFEALGWQVAEVRSLVPAALAYRRMPWFLQPIARFVPEPDPRRLGRARWSAVVRFRAPGACPPT